MVLATRLDEQQIKLRRDSYITLTWNYHVFEMRMVDLLVLRQVLDSFSADFPQSQSASILFNGFVLSLTAEDLSAFHQLVEEAASELPRQTVRWVDQEITIQPHDPKIHNGATQFSQN